MSEKALSGHTKAAAAERAASGVKSGVKSGAKSAPKRVRTVAAKAVIAVQPGLDFESPLDIICGVDEAGRGPLAGPVVAAAVILDPKRRIRGLDDSKVLSAKKREALYDKIVERSLAWCVASASVEEIDTLNILHATMLAMKRAVEGLSVVPTLAKIDGNRCPTLSVRSEAIVSGDALVPCISAASILAKVTRDRMLFDLHQTFPVYGFDAHAGYGTPQHLLALREHGPCAHHRRSFAPVREAHLRLGVALGDLPSGTVIVEPAAFGNDAFDDASLDLDRPPF
ncbi:ribonuclease HII [Paraburkholderia sp. 2C]